MKKNLFLLFSFYFFVLQSILAWLLWSESKFYWLALVNFVFIMLIAILTRWSDKTEDVEKNTEHKSMMNTKKSWKNNIFWWLLGIIIVLALAFFWLKFFNWDFNFNDWDFWDNHQDNNSWDVVSEWDIILEELTWNVVENSWSDVLSWNLFATWSEVEQTWFAEQSWLDNQENLDKLATFREVVKFLLNDSNNYELNYNTNVVFINVSKSDVDYPYFRTAYDKKMIWTDINPNKNLLCETYLVMKWLAEWRNVWSYSDIKKAYRDYASKNGLLPKCQKWKYVKIWDIL